MSLSGPSGRQGFWGNWVPLGIFIVLMIISFLMAHLRWGEGVLADWTPVAIQLAATLFMAVDRFVATKQQKLADKGVAAEARKVLAKANSLMDHVGDHNFRDRDKFYNEVLQEYGVRIFSKRNVRLGFYALEAADTEEGDSLYLRLAAEYETGDRMTPFITPNPNLPADQDIGRKMIDRAIHRQTLCVPDVTKDAPGWKARQDITKYKCFVSVPVAPHGTPAASNAPGAIRGLLNVDSLKVGDLDAPDKEWAQLIAELIYIGGTRWVGTSPIASNPDGDHERSYVSR